MPTPFPKNSVIDLHNDLLSYLAPSPQRSPHDLQTRSSIEQLRAGAVSCLVTAAYSPTNSPELHSMVPPGISAAELYPQAKRSQFQLQKQARIYTLLPKQFPEIFCHLHTWENGKIALVFAIENCSSFLSETEPLAAGICRFRRVCRTIRPLYVSLTWNGTNRLGGGTNAEKGLTDDGKVIIDMLQECVTAIDLSHASDRLAGDILRYLDNKKSPLVPIASHAQFRSRKDAPRNLPDELAEEITRRGGIIGLTMIKSFIGSRAETWYDHVAYALSRGWIRALAIGADFFVPAHLPPFVFPQFSEEHFFPSLNDASCFPQVQTEVIQRFGREIADMLFRENAWRLLHHHLKKWHKASIDIS